MNHTSITGLACLLAVALTACAGGGEPPAPSGSPAPAPLEALKEPANSMPVSPPLSPAPVSAEALAAYRALLAGEPGALDRPPEGLELHQVTLPPAEELDHDYLWRINRRLPERGNIGIFNRSYYEEVLVGRVHNLPVTQKLPPRCLTEDLWNRRYRQLRDYERYLTENGITVVKFFLHISREEQRRRFLDRIDDEAKNWKFSASDIAERGHWDDYMRAYEDAINATASREAPWYVIPADKKWFARLLISEIVVRQLEKLDPRYPEVGEEQKAALLRCREQLTAD